MKRFLLLIITSSFLFLGAVNAAPEAKKYGPIKAGQTLWGIAYKTRPKGVSRLQMMNALHKANPKAFEKGNINLLKKGATLYLPTNKDTVVKILSGSEVHVVESTNEANKNLDTLRSELTGVKEELARSKEALKGLNQHSDDLKEAQERVAVLATENAALKRTKGSSGSSKEADKVKAELTTLNEQFKKAQTQIESLEKEKKSLQSTIQKGTVASQQESQKALSVVTSELVKAKELIKTLAEKNKALQTDSLDPKLLADTKKDLATTHEELEALKVQNQLLRDQAINADVSQEQRNENNKKFSDTIAALNSDIGVLRSRIKELEELEKMKDTHITKLQKSLDHATTVIKEQAEVNKKMYARLTKMEKKDAEEAAEEDNQAAAAAVTNDNPSGPTPPAEQSGDSAASQAASSNSPANIVNFADKSAASPTTLAVTETLKDISPKFWLMLTLAGLLFVFALLWRVIAGKDELEAA